MIFTIKMLSVLFDVGSIGFVNVLRVFAVRHFHNIIGID